MIDLIEIVFMSSARQRLKKEKAGEILLFPTLRAKNTWMVRRVLTAALMLTCGLSVAVQIKTEHICLPPQWHKAAAFALNSLPMPNPIR